MIHAVTWSLADLAGPGLGPDPTKLPPRSAFGKAERNDTRPEIDRAAADLELFATRGGR